MVKGNPKATVVCSLERSQSRLEENGEENGVDPRREGSRGKIALMDLPVLKSGCRILLRSSRKMQC